MTESIAPDDPRVVALLKEWLRLRGEGRAPAPYRPTGDPAVLAALEEAIDDVVSGEQHFDEGADGPDAPPVPPRGVKGRYEVRDLVGAGGMGAVYRAYDHDLRVPVAYKVISHECARDPAAREKFLAEVRVTAGLQQAGVVPIHGHFVDDDGRPAYAMRLLARASRSGSEPGIGLGDYVDRFHGGLRSIPADRDAWREALGHFARICRTIDFAHDHDVLHRDLSDSNIMVLGGETFVIDWGLSTGVALLPGDPGAPADGRPPGEVISVLSRAGTVAYLAPEVLDHGVARPFGRPSDIYALGAILYLILTGEPPYPGEPVSLMWDRVREGPPRPVDEARPGVPPPLVAIAARAMARAPGDRYETAEALARDVERWLAYGRVAAYREPWPERAGRWAVRHRGPVRVAAAALVILAVGALLAYGRERGLRAEAVVQRKAALAERERALQALDETIAQAEFVGSKQTGSAASKRVLDRACLLLEERAREAEADPSSRAVVIGLHHRAAKIRFKLGQMPEAEAILARAAALAEALSREFPGDPTPRHLRAESLRELGVALANQRRAAEALPLWRTALELLEPIANPGSDPAYRHTLAQTHMVFGNVAMDAGQSREAHDSINRALALAEGLVVEAPASLTYRTLLADLDNNRGEALKREAVDAKKDVVVDPAKLLAARGFYLKALENRRTLAANDPDNPDNPAWIGWIYGALGDTYRLEIPARFAEAEAAYREAIAILGTLSVAFPGVPDHRDGMAHAYHALVKLAVGQGDWDQVEATSRLVVATFTQLARIYPKIPDHQAELGEGLEKLAEALRHRGATAEADARDFEAATHQARAAAILTDPAQAEPHAARAVAILGRLKAAGYFKDPRRLDAFEPLRSRADYKAALGDLAPR